jgi:hypothetical protein
VRKQPLQSADATTDQLLAAILEDAKVRRHVWPNHRSPLPLLRTPARNYSCPRTSHGWL